MPFIYYAMDLLHHPVSEWTWHLS